MQNTNWSDWYSVNSATYEDPKNSFHDKLTLVSGLMNAQKQHPTLHYKQVGETKEKIDQLDQGPELKKRIDELAEIVLP